MVKKRPWLAIWKRLGVYYGGSRRVFQISNLFFIDLNGTWRMKRTGEPDWLKATVPGSVYNDLLANGKMADPFYRDNEDQALALMSYDFIYEREFALPTDFLAHELIVLACDGLDTLAEIRINGKELAATDNMHRKYEFACKDFLKTGNNLIQILFRSPVNYITRKHETDPLWNATDAMPGASHLRKAHFMFGWDWGPHLPDAGIWRSIALHAYDKARISKLLITQAHQKKSVTLTIEPTAASWSTEKLHWEVTVSTPQGAKLAARTSVDNPNIYDRKEQQFFVEIPEPELWWPHIFGPQPLYKVTAELKAGQNLLDRKELRIGLRTLRVRREPDEWGESFEFEINGQPVFFKGANYIPEDNILARCNPARTEKLIQACLAANFNGLRVWGGGIYPPDNFYDLCDQYGLLVWQDLMFACAVYRLDRNFTENIRAEAIDNVRRLRHHASLALWCGNNEMEEAFVRWNLPHITPQLRADYLKQYEFVLAEVVEKEAPQTTYWPSSPSSGGSFDNPNDPNRGDVHYWEVWHGLKPFTDFRNYFFRFASEFGFQSFPGLKTVETFTRPEDRNVFSYVMDKHQRNGLGNGKIFQYLADNYLMPKDFPSLLYVSQLLQAEAIRCGVEHWRQNRGRCMGSIYWQLNDCWPVTSWSSIDYFGRWKALHYFAKRFYAPVLISARETGTKVELFITNDNLADFSGTIHWYLRENDGRVLEQGSKQVSVQQQSALCCAELDYSSALTTKNALQQTYLEYRLSSQENRVGSGTVFFTRIKYFKLLEPQVSVKISDTEKNFILDFQAVHLAKNLEIDLVDLDGLFSDNYFDLSPGMEYRVFLSKAGLPAELTTAALQEKLLLRSMYDAVMGQ